ncbi:MAG TPA: GNAT family N-acetyltransferase, partial [Stellaceae bacterium]|nr:GNAT family N-acetyltransferase [Stellaceae bacterium]
RPLRVSGAFRIEVLAQGHDRSGFDSGSEPLDRYLREQVTQDVRRRATACYVAVETERVEVAGYYTLAAGGVPLSEMPEPLAKRLPRYPSVPVARMGRLAVDRKFRGRQLGAALLWDAATRAARSEIAVFALVVDAKDDAASSFYAHHGFVAYGSSPRHLILPLARFRPAP